MKLQANKLSQGALPKPTRLAAAVARAFVGSVLASAVSQSALAAPTGGAVAAGSASITSTASTTVIRQSSNRAVLDWASFNITPREAVTFLQPGASAAALNRIHDASASQIFGQLNANGQIFLVNPNGIVFGRTAAVNVGSLMASTADISNNDFMAGRMNFAFPGKPRAAIVNEGSISAAQGGFVALAAPNVRNGGTISARLGRIALASGDSFSLDLYGDSLISVALDRDALAGLQDAQGQPVTRYVSNDGSILADGGRIEILAASAQNLLAAAVNLGGVVRARGAESRNGVIFLDAGSAGELAIGGQLDVSDTEGTGGRIDAAGAKISLLSGSRTDASGSRGGGGIVLGDMTATDRVEVASGAVIAADAGVQGDGGAVRLLSSRHTDFAGSISAKGGDQGGNGGTAEISSTGSVTLGSSDIRLTAHAGRAGTVLLDPTDLTIAHQPDSANVVSDFTLYNLLAAGNNVSLAATHDLTVLAAIEGRGGVAGGTVSLEAGHDLLVKNHILTNNGAITLTAGNLFSMDPNTILLAGNQPISVSGAAGVATQFIFTTGSVSLSSSAGPINAAQPLGYRDITLSPSDFPIGSLVINGSLALANAASTQTVTLNGVLASGAVNIKGYSVANGAGIESQGDVTLSAASNIQIGDISAANLTATTSNGSMTLGRIGAGQVALDSSADITLNRGAVVENGLTAHFIGNLTIRDSLLAKNGSAIELGAFNNSNTNAKINLYADILSYGGPISLNNDLVVFNFWDFNAASRYEELLRTTFQDPTAVNLTASQLDSSLKFFNLPGANHLVIDSTGGDGQVAVFKSLIFIDNTLGGSGSPIFLNMQHITNQTFTDDVTFPGFPLQSQNRLVVSTLAALGDVVSLSDRGGINDGDAVARQVASSRIQGTFFTGSGSPQETIYRWDDINAQHFEALNQYGYHYTTADSKSTYRLVISPGTVPSGVGQPAADWLAEVKGGQSPGSATNPTPSDAAFAEFPTNPISPGDSGIPQPPGVNTPLNTDVPGKVGSGNVAAELTLAFRAGDLIQPSGGVADGEGDPGAFLVPLTTEGGSTLPGDVVLGGPGALAEADLGRGTPLGGASHEVFGKRRCLALGAPGVSAQPCVGASR